MRKLFGTDGVRGKTNVYPLTGDVAFRLGQAIVLTFKGKNRMKVIIGKDTRKSGYIFESALTSGLCSMGANVYLVGPMPTPAIAHLVRSFAADAGIVISASHNPAGDNGIKFFDRKGYKLPDDVEAKIETLVLENKMSAENVKIEDVGSAFRIDDAQGRYIEFAKGSVGNMSLSGLKIVLDSAHGAAYKVAPLIFSELGADVLSYNNKPDGLNINKECGALYPDVLKSLVLGNHADVGISLDGDADRVIMVDEKGNILDGDRIMLVCAEFMKKNKTLKKNVVVGTVMSNMGFEKKLGENGINFLRTKVGDRYVIEEMRKNDYNIGGEQAGHIVLSDYNTTGDGTVTALQVLSIMKKSKKKLSELGNFESFPQILTNIEVKEKKPIEKLKCKKIIQESEKELGSNGRILVRYSGTENKCRVMIEGKEEDLIKKHSSIITKAIKQEIGK